MQYAVSSVQCDVPVRALSMHQYKYTQHLQTRENFLSNLKVKRQNGRHAKTSNNRSCTCTPVHVQVYTYMHPYLSGETLASNLNGKRQNGRHAKTSNNTSRTYIPARTWSSRETTYVIIARNDVRDHREKRRTWSPRETTYVIIARDDVRDHRERRRTWSSRETTYVITSRDNERDHRVPRVRVGVVKWSEVKIVKDADSWQFLAGSPPSSKIAHSGLNWESGFLTSFLCTLVNSFEGGKHN